MPQHLQKLASSVPSPGTRSVRIAASSEIHLPDGYDTPSSNHSDVKSALHAPSQLHLIHLQRDPVFVSFVGDHAHSFPLPSDLNGGPIVHVAGKGTMSVQFDGNGRMQVDVVGKCMGISGWYHMATLAEEGILSGLVIASKLLMANLPELVKKYIRFRSYLRPGVNHVFISD